MNMNYKKSKDNKVFIAFYGHIAFAAVLNYPGSRSMTLGIVDDTKAVELEMDVCNRADFETFIEGINDPTKIVDMYKSLVNILVREKLIETTNQEE